MEKTIILITFLAVGMIFMSLGLDEPTRQVGLSLFLISMVSLFIRLVI